MKIFTSICGSILAVQKMYLSICNLKIRILVPIKCIVDTVSLYLVSLREKYLTLSILLRRQVLEPTIHVSPRYNSEYLAQPCMYGSNNGMFIQWLGDCWQTNYQTIFLATQNLNVVFSFSLICQELAFLVVI